MGADAALSVSAPQSSAGWDLSLGFTEVRLGSGSSGAGEAKVLMLPEADFDALSAAPSGDYARDADTDSDGQTDSFGFAAWYDYDFITHTVTPKDQVYAMRTSDGLSFKLRFTSFDGTTIGLQYAEIAP